MGEPHYNRLISVDSVLRDRAISVGKAWRETPASIGKLPAAPDRVVELWKALAPHSSEPVFVAQAPNAEGPTWWLLILELLMIADEASRGLGFDASNVFYRPIAGAFVEGDVISGREFRRIQSGPATVSTADSPPVPGKLSAALFLLYFSGGRDRTMIWDIHRNVRLRC